ncbi:MAG: DEAD/DEAH box helicase [Deltaproteobacteria bacterium]|nr:DEAD/DEAH box helicase [Deltaproteobacteria bacterium]
MDFKEFHFHPSVAAGITAAGFERPTPIQEKAIIPLMKGLDVMGLAQTGTGKTAAFALPLLNRFVDKKRGRVRALIIAPTRELAEQIHQDINTLGTQTRLRCITLYGGVPLNPQIQKLKRGAEIIVACPGRLIDHINRGNVDFSLLEVLVLDEADQMLDMGFIPDIRKILKRIPTKRQTLMFSATMPNEIRQLAFEVLCKPVTVQVGNTAPADTVSHFHFPVAQDLKTSLLLKILKDTDVGSVLVFTRTKQRAKRLSEALCKAGYGSTSLQGNLSQARRQAALNGFRSGRFQILVATDIAARGIDVSNVSHVVNYDVPTTPEAYIHRIGRTGRAEKSGKAFNLITSDDSAIVRSIDRILGSQVKRCTFSDFDYSPSTRPSANKEARSTRSWKSLRKSDREHLSFP